MSRLPLCDECRSRVESMRGRVFSLCGERLFTSRTEAQGVCGECRTNAPPFLCAMAYGGHDGGLRELIYLPKDGRVHPAAGVLGSMLAEVIQGGSEFLISGCGSDAAAQQHAAPARPEPGRAGGRRRGRGRAPRGRRVYDRRHLSESARVLKAEATWAARGDIKERGVLKAYA